MRRTTKLCLMAAAAMTAPALAHAQMVTGFSTGLGSEFVTGGVNIAPVEQTSLFARDRDVSVRERPRPDYQETGVRSGGIWLYPKLEGDVEYNDNIYATSTGEISDEIFRIKPELVLQSNWSRNYFDLYGRASANEYAKNTSENTTDWDFGGDGRLDIVRGTDIRAGGEVARLTVPRTSSTSPSGALTPVQYYQDTAYVIGEREVNRFRMTLKGSWGSYTYNNVPAIGGGTIINTDLNHDEYDMSGRVDYALSPRTAWFVEGDGNWRPYHTAGILTPQRSSEGYQFLTGANFEVTSLIRGEIGVGYLKQMYDSPSYTDVGGFGLRGKLEWFPSELTTVTLTGDRSVQDSGIIGSSGYLATNIGAQIDHELLRNVILSASGLYGHDTYNGVDRGDSRYQAGISATYLVNRRVGLSAGYVYFKQDSSGTSAGQNFAVNRLTAALALQY
jgi:hypothetical protein